MKKAKSGQKHKKEQAKFKQSHRRKKINTFLPMPGLEPVIQGEINQQRPKPRHNR